MSLESLRVELGGLEWCDAQEREGMVLEGTGDTGLSAVVELLARNPA